MLSLQPGTPRSLTSVGVAQETAGSSTMPYLETAHEAFMAFHSIARIFPKQADVPVLPIYHIAVEGTDFCCNASFRTNCTCTGLQFHQTQYCMAFVPMANPVLIHSLTLSRLTKARLLA